MSRGPSPQRTPISEPREQEAARAALIAILERDPTDLDALTALGSLLHATGLYQSSRVAFEEAVKHHPEVAAAHTNLANAYLDVEWMNAARTHYVRALELDPLSVQAQRGLALLLLRTGEGEAARELGRFGFAEIAMQPHRGDGAGIPLLLITSGLAGNMNTTARFWDDRIFAKATVVAEFWEPEDALPPHRLIFNAIGDADLCGSALLAAQRLVAGSTAPVINDPNAVRRTGRLENAQRLGLIENVVTAKTARVSRKRLCSVWGVKELEEQGLAFPLLLRSPGFQTGRNFELVEHPRELSTVAAALPGEELLAMEYLDVRDPDGWIRKYRALAVAGRLYPNHLAIGGDWKVHYYTAAMDREEHRREEAAFLADMSVALGSTAIQALERVVATLGLDYAGIDFSLDAGGRVVLFEANATMVLREVDPGETFAYRQRPVERIFEAVHAMLIERARWTPDAKVPIPQP